MTEKPKIVWPGQSDCTQCPERSVDEYYCRENGLTSPRASFVERLATSIW